MTRLQGYIVLWSDEADVDGTLETFGAYPFQEPLVAHLTAAHLPGHRYAYTTSGQLRLEQDDVGLRLEVDAGEDREWARLCRAIQAGMRGASFTFWARERQRDGDRVTITKARLSEVCVTGSPAYPGGGIWFDGEDDLPPHLARLQDHWHACATVDRPVRIDQERAAFQASRRWAAGLVEPMPQARLEPSAVSPDPIQRLARAHVRRYLGTG